MPQSSCTFISSLDLLKRTHTQKGAPSVSQCPLNVLNASFRRSLALPQSKPPLCTDNEDERRWREKKNSHTDQSRDLLKTKYLVSGCIMSFSSYFFVSLLPGTSAHFEYNANVWQPNIIFIFRRAHSRCGVRSGHSDQKWKRYAYTAQDNMFSFSAWTELTWKKETRPPHFCRTFVGLSRRYVV